MVRLTGSNDICCVPVNFWFTTVWVIVAVLSIGDLLGENSRESTILSPSTSLNSVSSVPVPGRAEGTVVSDSTSTDMVRKQNLQQQVRQMAKRLVADRLNEQILQLEENGLTHLPLYAELREMQGHLDELVETHMKEVLLALEQLVQAPPEKQAGLLQLAREKSRDVLVRLLIEREKILRRLRIAEIEERVIRLIEREAGVLERTRKVPIENTVQQAASAVAIREDQQDVYTLYRGLKQSLNEIQTWGGRVGSEATAALQALTEADVDGLFTQSLQRLLEGQLIDAAKLEGEIIAALEKLLERIRRFQGEMENDSKEAVRQAIEDMAQRQQELRQQTLNADRDPQKLEPLTENQLQLQKEIEGTAKKLSQELEPLREAARAASQATESLFQGETQQAAEHQQTVVDHLLEAAENLQMAREHMQATESMDSQVAHAQVADLRQVKAELEKIRQEQTQVSQAAQQGQLKEAAEAESQLGQKIDEVASERPLPENVNTAIKQAAETVRQASQMLSRANEARAEAGNKVAQQDPQVSEQSSHGQETANKEPGAVPAANEDAPEESASQKKESPTGERTLSASDVRMATRQAEQAIDEAISAVEMALADAERARLAAELVEAVQGLRERGSPNSEDQAALAQQKAAELQQLTQQQLNQVQAAKRAVEAELPLASTPARQALEQLNALASQVVEAAASQQEAMGRDDVAQDIRSAADLGQALELARQAGEDAGMPTSQSSNDHKAAAQENVTTAATKALASLAELANLPQSATADRQAAAREALESVKQASEQASKHLAMNTEAAKNEALAHQEVAASGLAKAAEQIRGLVAELVPQVAGEFAQHSQSAEELANMAIPVHPEATSSLHAAENAAQRAANQIPQRPQVIPEGERGFEHGLTTAAAVLAEREDQLSRALAAAQKIPELLSALGKQPDLPAGQSSSQDRGETTADPAERALAAIQAAAQQIASPQAKASMPSQSAENLPKNQESSQPSDAASADSQGGVARGGALSQNVVNSQRPLQPQTSQVRADSRGSNQHGQSVVSQSKENNVPPWLLELPTQMREAIRSGMALPPPKGYEDRLRRYFQNLE